MEKVYYIVISIVLSLLVYLAFVKIINSLIKIKSKYIEDSKRNTVFVLLKNISKYVIIVVEIIIILAIIGINVTTIVAGLGIVGAVIGLAFQDLLKDLIAGLFIVFEDQYRISDNIMVDNFRGEVIFLGLKTTKIKSYTGEIKIISNGKITNVINYSRENSNLLVNIPSSYDVSVNKMEKVIDLIIKDIEQLEDVVLPIDNLGIDKLDDNAVIYSLLVSCKPMTHFSVKRQINKVIKNIFDKNKLQIPYKQLDIHYQEGKKGEII